MRGGSKKNPIWTEGDVETLRAAYALRSRESESVAQIARRLGRSCFAVQIKASSLKLKKRWSKCQNGKVAMARESRSITWNNLSPEQQHQILSARRKLVLSKIGHPKGMQGKHHSQKTKDLISTIHSGKKVPREIIEKGMKTKIERYGKVAPLIPRGSWKAGWRQIGDRRIYARSIWEANYARFLEFQKVWGQIADWEHEPETFWFEKIKRGIRSYLPDFKLTLTNGNVEYHEVKGWMDPASKTKIKRMAKYHPAVVLNVIDARWFKANLAKLRGCIPEWESARYG